MKITRKLFGGLLILILIGLVIWIPADLTSTAQQVGHSQHGYPDCLQCRTE